jgi:pimeloyl-ACP methyl ester carboxylesterase
MGIRAAIVGLSVAFAVIAGGSPGIVSAQDVWQTVPDPAVLPAPDASGMARVNATDIYYEIHGTKGPWIIFLHGGMGSALAWGNQVPAFAAHNRVLLIESRGHGRSGWDGGPITYEAMASDVVGVMDALGIAKADVVGWSDGGIIALILGIDHADRVDKIVADGANTDPEGVDNSVLDAAPYNIPSDRDEKTYKALSPTPERWKAFSDAINKMWASEPHITDKLGRISSPVLVMAGEHDLIKPEHTRMIADSISGAMLDIVPDAAHFIVWQQPDAFNRDVKAFLGVE